MWFDGPIENAISKAKSEKRLLIIFVSGEDEVSRRVYEFWSNGDVEKIVTENSCIALKLTEGSAAAKQFAQIYPVVKIPICFFISPHGGMPLEVLLQYESIDAFKDHLNRAIEMFRNSATTTVQGQDTPAPDIPSSDRASNSPNDEQDRQTPSPTTDSPSSSNNLEDRLQKAQTLIKERQEQKAREEQEKAQLAELKRRQEGREFQKAQERVKEQEMLRNANEQKKAKQEDKEYLMKLREQIAADRAEKAAKFSAVQNAEQKQKEELKQQKVKIDERQRQEEEEKRRRYALIQFRLPDGSSIRNQFEGTMSFAEAEQWASNELSLEVSKFILVQMYPRREFTSSDREQSLAELGLTPTAVLMVLPNASAGASTQGPKQSNNGFLSLLWSMVTAPVLYAYDLMYRFVFGAATAPRPVTGPSSENKSGPVPDDQKPSTSGTTGANMTQFRNPQDTEKTDDDNATWNGNSTQQL